MKGSKKRVLTAILEKPCTLADLMRLRLPAIKIKQATHSLIKAGDIQCVDDKFYIKKKEIRRDDRYQTGKND